MANGAHLDHVLVSRNRGSLRNFWRSARPLRGVTPALDEMMTMRVARLAPVLLFSALVSCAAAPRPCECASNAPRVEPPTVPVCTPAPVASSASTAAPPDLTPPPEHSNPPQEQPRQASPTKPGTPGVLGYAELWRSKPTGWAAASVITPTGDLATSAADVLTINARHNGAALESAKLCAPVGPRAMTVLRGKLYLACGEEVVEVTVPGLASRTVLSGVLKASSSLFRDAAFGADTLAYTHNDGSMEIYSTKTWTKLSNFTLPKDTFAQNVAVSPNGKRITVTNDDAKIVHLFIDGRQHTLKELREVIAFSPDSARAFGSSGSFAAADVALTGGPLREVMATGSWLTAAIYFDKDLLAVAESDGISVKNLATGQLQHLIDMVAETLAVSPDGNLICGADRGDTIACFGRGAIAPSTYPKASP